MAKYGALYGVSAMAVSKWKKRGWLVFDGNSVNVKESDKNLKKYRSAQTTGCLIEKRYSIKNWA